MNEREGVIKYEFHHRNGSASFDLTLLDELLRWRSQMVALGMLGQDPRRYDGVGFGNVSFRFGDGFVVSGSQTSGLSSPTPADFVVVERWDFQAHRLWSHGECLPSSESLTHAAVYESWPNVECVLHGHAPMIWDCAEGLGLESTPVDVDYGTPEMVHATRVLASVHTPLDFFVMKGHQDGVVSLGNTIDEAGRRLLAVWASVEGWRTTCPKVQKTRD